MGDSHLSMLRNTGDIIKEKIEWGGNNSWTSSTAFFATLLQSRTDNEIWAYGVWHVCVATITVQDEKSLWDAVSNMHHETKKFNFDAQSVAIAPVEK